MEKQISRPKNGQLRVPSLFDKLLRCFVCGCTKYLVSFTLFLLFVSFYKVI